MLALPANQLYHVAPESFAGYLVETDPTFANYRTWLSSDTLLSVLGITPAGDQKRLHDGSTQRMLVSQVYARVRESDLAARTALDPGTVSKNNRTGNAFL